MGSLFILGGLTFAVVGGLVYYFLSKSESEEPEKEKVEKVEQTPYVEVLLFN